MRRALLLTALLPLGCTTQTVRLADLKSPVFVPTGDFGHGGIGLLTSPSGAGARVASQPVDGECDVLGADVKATRDGVALPLVSATEANTSVKGKVIECSATEFGAAGTEAPPAASDAATVFELTDASATFHVEYPTLKQARTLVAATASPWWRGQPVQLTWSPASDVLTQPVPGSPPFAFLRYDGGPDVDDLGNLHFPDGGSTPTVFELPIAVAPGQVTVTLPGAAAAGDATLQVQMPLTVPASVCRGPAACDDFPASYSFDLPARVAP